MKLNFVLSAGNGRQKRTPEPPAIPSTYHIITIRAYICSNRLLAQRFIAKFNFAQKLYTSRPCINLFGHLDALTPFHRLSFRVHLVICKCFDHFVALTLDSTIQLAIVAINNGPETLAKLLILLVIDDSLWL